MFIRIFQMFLALVLALSLTGCPAMKVNPRTKNEPAYGAKAEGALSRADPGYIYTLERKSMLWNSGEDARIVSGSELGWRNPGLAANPDGLPALAGVWLWVSPHTLLVHGRKSTLEQLSEPGTWMILGRLGIKGLYVAPTAGSGLLWSYDRSPYSDGDDIVQYDFAESTGKKEHFMKLLQSANASRSIVGGDVTPAAAGIGPDFFLAAMFQRDYPGAFCFIEAPKELWPLLPQVESEWQCKALSAEQQRELSAKKILPLALKQDSLPFGLGSGWAATGEVRGVDGNLRRWLYRYYGTPKRPVLNWEDPSAAGKRIISGSIIRQAGLLGNALVGYKVAPLLGLDSTSADGGAANPLYEPAPGAAKSIGREIRRYGAWSWQRDTLPLSLLKEAQEQQSTDFITDSALHPAAEHALLTGRTDLLKFMLNELVDYKIDLRRLAHSSGGPDGFSYDFPHLSALAADPHNPKAAKAGEFKKKALEELSALALADGQDESQLVGNHLYTTPAGVAALALSVADPAKVTPELALEAGKGLRVLMSFKAMLPGLLVVSGQDLSGALPLNWRSMEDAPDKWDKRLSSRGTYTLFANAESISVSAYGVPKAKSIFPPADVQMHAPDSFGQYLAKLVALRDHLGIAGGTFIGSLPVNNPGVIATATKLPGKAGFIVCVCNFSREKANLTLDSGSLPELQTALGKHKAEDAMKGQPVEIKGQSLHLFMDGWDSKVILVSD